MGIYKRLPRSKPKTSDELVTWTQGLLHWIEINWRLVLGGIGLVGVVAAVVVLIANYIGGRDEAARKMLYLALKDPAPQTALEKVIKDYPKGSSSNVARLKLGDFFYEKGDFSKAIEAWVPLVSESNPEIRILALHNIAAATLEAGSPEEAAAKYLNAYKDTKNPAKGFSYFNAAVSLLKANKTDDAKKIFEEISNGKEEYPSSLVEKSSEYLIWMAAKK